MIDLRSDTVTRPTTAMRQAMANASVGDDVYGEDPTVNRLEAFGAALLGKEASLFVPTGTMANQLALRCQTQPGDAVVLEAGAHIGDWESGAPAVLSGLSLLRVAGTDGIIDLHAAFALADRSPNDHVTPVRVLAVENTANAGGGTPYPAQTLRDAVAGCQARGLVSHCDGARLWNAAAAMSLPPEDLVAGFDSVSVCLSKGLGAPGGSLLAGSRDLIRRARRFRKMFGGGMRQAGILAAGGLFALENHRSRLHDDHAHARMLAEGLAAQGWTVTPPTTNMVYLEHPDAAAITQQAAQAGVRFGTMSPTRARMVTHLDISEEDIQQTLTVMAQIAASRPD
ncbi:MAG: GntG family PLP-dependent aldolase [Myxococcota bacterium]